MPVKARFLNHFIMAAHLEIPPSNLYQNNNIKNYPACYMESMKASNSKEISTKCHRPGRCHHLTVKHNMRAPGVMTGSSSPMLYGTIYQHFMRMRYKMRPFHSLATQKSQPTKNGQKQPLFNTLLIHFMPFVNS